MLVLSWGGTYGPVACRHAPRARERRQGRARAPALANPFPANVGDVLRSYDKVLIPEMNLGQLLELVRARYLVDAVGYNRVQGKLFKAGEIAAGWRVRGRLSTRARTRGAEADRRRTSSPTRKSAGARVAATTRSSPRCRASCRSSGSRRRRSCSSRASAARRASRTTCRRTACTRSTARARDRDRPRRLAPDLSVWVISGDGDALSIGGNHLIHALRRNVNIKILIREQPDLRADQWAVLTDERAGKGHGLDADGSVDYPFNPLSVALGADATFVARALDTDKPGLTNVLRRDGCEQGDGLRRDLPELQHLQRQRVRLRP